MEVKIAKYNNCKLDEIFIPQDGGPFTITFTHPTALIQMDMDATEVERAAQMLAEVAAEIEAARDPQKAKVTVFPVKSLHLEKLALHEDNICLRVEPSSGTSFRFLLPMNIVQGLQQSLHQFLQRAAKSEPPTKQ